MYCIRVSTDLIEDPKHQKGAEHCAEAHAQQECRREHKHYDVPHDAIDRRHQQGAKQIPDTHEKRRFQDAEGGVFKPCQQRKGIQQNDAVQNCRTNKHCSEQRPENVFAPHSAQHKAIRSQETADCQQDKPEFCGRLKIFPERLKKHPGQTIVPIFRHFERDVEQCGRRSPYGNDGQAAHEP